MNSLHARKLAGSVIVLVALLVSAAQAKADQPKPRLTVQDRWTAQVNRDVTRTLAFHPDSAIVASGHATSRIRLWQAGQAKSLRTIEVPDGRGGSGVTALDFDASGQRLVSNAGFMNAVNRVVVWPVDTGAPIHTKSFDGHLLGLVSLGDGDDLLVITGECVQRPFVDPPVPMAVRVWRPLVSDEPSVLEEAAGIIACPIALDPTRRFLATRGGDTQLRIWDIKKGSLLKKIELGDAGGYCGAFSSDGRLLVIREGRSGLRVYDVQSGALVRKLKAEDEKIGHIAVSSEANLIAAGDAKGRIVLWDLRTGDRIGALHEHKEAIVALVFSPNGRWLASAGADDAILLWRVEKK